MYDLGSGVPQDHVEGARLIRLAAEQGHVQAQSKLGEKYTLGRDVPQDLAEAVKMHTLAAEQGGADAQYTLGAMYALGRGGVKQDLA